MSKRRYGKGPSRPLVPPTKKPLANLVRFECSSHGFLVDAIEAASVWCPCGRKAVVR